MFLFYCFFKSIFVFWMSKNIFQMNRDSDGQKPQSNTKTTTRKELSTKKSSKNPKNEHAFRKITIKNPSKNHSTKKNTQANLLHQSVSGRMISRTSLRGSKVPAAWKAWRFSEKNNIRSKVLGFLWSFYRVFPGYF